MSYCMLNGPSEHFSWEEVTGSDTATSQGIANDIPPAYQVNAVALAQVLERVRFKLNEGMPVPVIVHVNSWYRSPALNVAVRGCPNSWHTKGLAADIWVQGWEQQALAEFVKAVFEECVPWGTYEIKTYDSMVHVALKDDGTPSEFLTNATSPLV